MATPIKNFQDILDALESNPQLRAALRRHILSDELVALPETFAAFVSETRDNFRLVHQPLHTLETNVTEIKTTQASMGGTLRRLDGRNYESHAARRTPLLATQLLHLLSVTTVSSPGDTQWLDDLAMKAHQDGTLTNDEAQDLQEADLVLEAIPFPNNIDPTPALSLYPQEPQPQRHPQLCILAEISITVQQRDLTRVLRRATILQKATGVRTTPILIGTALEDGLDTGNTAFLAIPALD